MLSYSTLLGPMRDLKREWEQYVFLQNMPCAMAQMTWHWLVAVAIDFKSRTDNRLSLWFNTGFHISLLVNFLRHVLFAPSPFHPLGGLTLFIWKTFFPFKDNRFASQVVLFGNNSKKCVFAFGGQRIRSRNVDWNTGQVLSIFPTDFRINPELVCCVSTLDP